MRSGTEVSLSSISRFREVLAIVSASEVCRCLCDSTMLCLRIDFPGCDDVSIFAIGDIRRRGWRVVGRIGSALTTGSGGGSDWLSLGGSLWGGEGSLEPSEAGSS